jgi:hypothetical protein
MTNVIVNFQLLRKEMVVEKSHRSKRDYSVFEQVDDISTTAWTPPRYLPTTTNDTNTAFHLNYASYCSKFDVVICYLRGGYNKFQELVKLVHVSQKAGRSRF